MKKLVIGACALAAVSAMAVESTNIVGYADSQAKTPHDLYVSQFIPLGKDASQMILGDIVPNAAFQYARVILWNGANQDETVTYLDQAYCKDLNDEYGTSWTAGWYDYTEAIDNWEITTGKKDNKAVPFGRAVSLQANAGTGIIFSGEVKSEATELVASTPHDLFGNCSPVNITLGDIVPNAAFQYARVILWNGANQDETVTYLDQAYCNELNAEYGTNWTAGWYNYTEAIDNWEITTGKKDSKVIPAGAMFSLQATAGSGVIIPSAL